MFQRRYQLLAASVFCVAVTGSLFAQNSAAKPNQTSDPLLHSFEFRSIGPAIMSGRLDDIQGSAKDPLLLYVGFATGGLYKSTDAGNHWKSMFDNAANESIGAIAIAPSDPNIVYVGRGEANNRQSSSVGDGIWGTTDGGKTWKSLGLEKTQSINRIAVDPVNPKIVFVASPGHLFGPNPERGLYRTTDGGATWKLVKYIDENTGFNDVAIDPANPKIVYASSFQRRRNGWGYNGGGPNGGLWKSVNGGESWTKLDGPGWPKPKDGLYGRIAIAIFPGNSKIIYAQVEAGASAGAGSGTDADGGPEKPGANPFGPPAAAVTDAKSGAADAVKADAGKADAKPATPPPPPPPNPNGNGVYRSDDGGKTWVFVSDQNQRPTYFSQIRVDPKNVNKLLVGGTPGQMSLDGGKTWKSLTASHTDYHAIWISPADPRMVAVGHDGGLDISFDGGFTWDYHNDIAAGQFYQVSADMRHPYHVCGGLQDNAAWCGPSALRNNTGPVNTDWYSVAGGDGFYTRQDPLDWTIIYAESQDGNMARHDLKTGTQKSIKPTLPAPPPAAAKDAAKDAAKPAGDAPKPEVPVATTPATSVPDESRSAGTPAAGGRRGAGGAAATAAAATPAADAGGFGRQSTPNISNVPKNVDPLRFYWNAPFEVSPFDPAVVYMAGQYFFKSINRGDTWTMSDKDLTKKLPRWAADRPIMGVAGDKAMVAKHDGYASSSMATQLRVSPSRPGVVWIGTDDGNLQVSQDDGVSFTNVYGNITGAPQGYVQVERIEPSHFDPGTAYVALNNHRNDDFAPYLYKTTDYGKTWTNVSANLPVMGSVNALREDLENPDLLFVGTEFGMFLSIDGAKSWQRFMNGMPTVRVDDILIHPREHDLIVGTHGRAIWIMDDISPLEHLKQARDSDLFLFEPRPAVLWRLDEAQQRHGANRITGTNREFVGTNPAGGTAIHVYAKSDMGKGKVEFLQGTKVVSTIDVEVKAGLNSYQWNMRGPISAAAAAAAARRPAVPVRESVPADPSAVQPTAAEVAAAEALEVPFVATGTPGGGSDGGYRQVPRGPLLEPGTYMIRLTVGGKTVETSVALLDDQWLLKE